MPRRPPRGACIMWRTKIKGTGAGGSGVRGLGASPSDPSLHVNETDLRLVTRLSHSVAFVRCPLQFSIIRPLVHERSWFGDGSGSVEHIIPDLGGSSLSITTRLNPSHQPEHHRASLGLAVRRAGPLSSQ